METLVVFLVIFIPFGWFMWKVLRYTRNTIGTNSPLKVKRIYKIGAEKYFFKSDNFFGVFCIIFGLFLFRMILTSPMAPDVGYPKIVRGTLLLLMAAVPALGVVVLAMDFNHWKYVDGVVLETFPEERELELTFGDTKLRLRDGDIIRMLITSNDAKLRVSYITYYLANGNHFILSDKMPGVWVIQEYFKKIPTEYKQTAFPFIT